MAEAVRVPAHGAVRVPASPAAMPLSRSALSGAELPQAKEVLHICAQGCFCHVQLFVTL